MSIRLNYTDQLSKEDMLEKELSIVRHRYVQEQIDKNKLLEKERNDAIQLADAKILHYRTLTLKELLCHENQRRVNDNFLVYMKQREAHLKNELRYSEIVLNSLIAAEKTRVEFSDMCNKYEIEKANNVRVFEDNLSSSDNGLYNVTIHQPLSTTRCNVSINGRPSCNDGQCPYTHNNARAKLLCKHEVAIMNQCRRNATPYDRDDILNVTFTCPHYDCPLKHFCYVCSYAPSCSCRMVHEHRFNTSKGYIGSIVNQTFHNNRLQMQCGHRFTAAIQLIRNAAYGQESSFCDNTIAYLKCHFECIAQNAGRQPNEKLGFIWQIIGFAFNNCATCSTILDAVVCENSPQTCPNNGVSIRDFMNNFKLSTSMPLRHDNPVMSNLGVVLDSDDEIE
jgi:hypothetical protein